MLRLRTALGLAVLSLLAPACVSSDVKDIRVESEANPEVDFEGYSSYAWAAAAAMVRDPDGDWTVPELDIGAEIVHLVNRELRARDMTEVVSSPDLLVVYGVGIDMKSLDVIVDAEDGSESMVETPKGAVMVILTDPKARRIVWVGSASADLVEEPSMELAKKRLDYAIKQMFKKSPF